MHGPISKSESVLIRATRPGEWEVVVVDNWREARVIFHHEEFAQSFATGQAHRLGVAVSVGAGTNFK